MAYFFSLSFFLKLCVFSFLLPSFSHSLSLSLFLPLFRLRSHPSVFVFLYGSDESPPANIEQQYLQVIDNVCTLSLISFSSLTLFLFLFLFFYSNSLSLSFTHVILSVSFYFFLPFSCYFFFILSSNF